MPSNNVRFLSGTAEKFATITKDSYTFYLVGGENLYLGDKLLTNAADVTAAVARIAQNETDISSLQSDMTTLKGNADVSGSVRNLAAAAVEALNTQLAAVAKSGAAEDVSVEDTAGKLDATDVEAALAEIVGMVEDTESAGAVTIDHTTGTLVYDFYQGGNDANHKIGTITIPEDMVATAGEIVYPSAEHPITIDGQQVTSGTYIKLTIANGDPFYIDVANLIEYNDVDDTAEIALDNTNHVITATIVEVNGSKLAAGSVAEAKLDSGVQGKLALASSAVQSVTATASTGNDGTITVDGSEVAVKGLGSAAFEDTTAFDAAGTGAAAAAAVLGESTDASTANTVYGAKAAASAADTKAQGALDLIGTIPGTSSATTVVDYVDEQTAGGISSLSGSATIHSVANGVVTLKHGVSESAGVISNDQGSDTTLAKLATSGAAVDVSISDSGNLFTGSEVETALAEAMGAANAAQSDVDALETLVGTIPQASSATDVVGYVDEQFGVVNTALQWGSF